MALNPVFKEGNTALVTGAASGIGLAVAQLCHKHGMKLALVDVNAEQLIKAKDSFGNQTEVETYTTDVSKLEQWKSLQAKVEAKFDRVDFLMLNAAIGSKSTWEDTAYFHKVPSPRSTIKSLTSLTPFLNSADHRYQSLRRHQRHRHISPFDPCSPRTLGHCHHWFKARYHQPTRQPGL